MSNPVTSRSPGPAGVAVPTLAPIPTDDSKVTTPSQSTATSSRIRNTGMGGKDDTKKAPTLDRARSRRTKAPVALGALSTRQDIANLTYGQRVKIETSGEQFTGHVASVDWGAANAFKVGVRQDDSKEARSVILGPGTQCAAADGVPVAPAKSSAQLLKGSRTDPLTDMIEEATPLPRVLSQMVTGYTDPTDEQNTLTDADRKSLASLPKLEYEALCPSDSTTGTITEPVRRGAPESGKSFDLGAATPAQLMRLQLGDRAHIKYDPEKSGIPAQYMGRKFTKKQGHTVIFKATERGKDYRMEIELRKVLPWVMLVGKAATR